MNFYYYKSNNANSLFHAMLCSKKSVCKKKGIDNIRWSAKKFHSNIAGFISFFSLTIIMILITMVLIVALFLSLYIDIQKLENQVDTLALTLFTDLNTRDDDEYSFYDRMSDEIAHCERINTLTVKANAYLDSCNFVGDELRIVIKKRPSSDFLRRVFPNLMVNAESRTMVYYDVYQDE